MKILSQLIFVLLYTGSYGQLFHQKINTYNSDGKKDGLWITYFNEDDEEKKIVSSREHYKDGIEAGVCKHYHSNGNIRLKWRYYKNRVRAKYYYENRQLEEKGWARVDWDEREIHYYWHGKWKFFDTQRRLIRVGFYVNGEEVVNQL
jgi:antitoxin component YwqK of YwqJK toxin-antitoxin module